MNSQFYVTLPSNTEMGSTASNFRVKLPQRIKLDGEWEVGLVEVIYPNSWYNITSHKQENIVNVQIILNDQVHTIKLEIPPLFYKNISNLIEALNTLINRSRKKDVELKDGFLKFNFDVINDETFISLDPNVVRRISTSDKIAQMLGFNGSTLYKYRPSDIVTLNRYSTKPPSIGFDIQTMYIYCNIVENQIVGNTLAPLLRIIDIQGDFKNVVNKTYDDPHYIPVLIKDMTAIEINIKTDMNEFIPFEFGKVVVKLHFRRRSYF